MCVASMSHPGIDVVTVRNALEGKRIRTKTVIYSLAGSSGQKLL
jgi:hypothetical protein